MESGKSGCKKCAAMIRLCSGLDFFPADVEVRRLLVERLHRLAKSHYHAKAMVERWLDTQAAAPKVVDLVSLAAAVSAGQNLPAGCVACCGHPWVVVNGRGARRCDCARGQALAALDVARATGQAA